MLLILGKNKLDGEESDFLDWYGSDDGSSYDVPDKPSIVGDLIFSLVLLILGLIIGGLFGPKEGYYLLIGLGPEHVRNLTFRPLKKGGVSMIVEMYDGNLLEIISSQECYNKVNTWWQNNRFQNRIN